MPVAVACACSHRFTLKDEFAGRLVRCPACDAAVRAGSLTPGSDADPVFGRDLFLLSQKVAWDERHVVTDDQGEPLAFVERPNDMPQLALAFVVSVVTVVAGFTLTAALIDLAATIDRTLAVVAAVAGVAGTVVASLSLQSALRPLLQVTLYRDEHRTETLLSLRQDARFQPVVHAYTIRDGRGRILGSLRRNGWASILRRRWGFHAVDGRPVVEARGDWPEVVARLFRTDFTFRRHGTGEVVGSFRRRFTILDRYVLDLSADPQRTLDRRVALLMGVMLDTGERR